LPERYASQPLDFPLPLREDPDEPARLRCEAGSATAPAPASGGQHGPTENLFHPAQPVETGPIAPADSAPATDNRSGFLDRREKAQVVWPHEENTVPRQPDLLLGREVTAESGSLRR
jgi:hypothetical protein